MTSHSEPTSIAVIGGVDTHKDIHVAAVVDAHDRVMGTRSFPTTRQGYRQLLAWMRTFGDLQRVGVESSGSYGAGLLRALQQAGVTVLEVTAPDCQSAHKNDPDRLANLTPNSRRLGEADAGVRTARVCARPGWPVGRNR